MLLRQKILSTQILDRLKEKGMKNIFIDSFISIHWFLTVVFYILRVILASHLAISYHTVIYHMTHIMSRILLLGYTRTELSKKNSKRDATINCRRLLNFMQLRILINSLGLTWFTRFIRT